jgi:hypothetical protein
MFILEHAVKDEKFLSTVVRMRGKMATRCVANDRRGSGHLIAYAIQHAPLNPGHRRRDPGQPAGVDGDATGKISIEFHPCLLPMVSTRYSMKCTPFAMGK